MPFADLPQYIVMIVKWHNRKRGEQEVPLLTRKRDFDDSIRCVDVKAYIPVQRKKLFWTIMIRDVDHDLKTNHTTGVKNKSGIQ